MWELDYKESWALKNWCFWTVVLEKTLESPSDCKEIQPVHLKRDPFWVFIARTDVFELWCWRRLLRVPRTAKRSNQSILKEISPEYSSEGLTFIPKLQYFGHLMQRTDSFNQTLMLGQIEGRWRRGQQRMRWHHWLNGHEFEQTPGDSEGQGSLTCCSPWRHKKLDTNERLKNNNNERGALTWLSQLGLMTTGRINLFCVLSHFSCIRLFVTLQTVACQAPLS